MCEPTTIAVAALALSAVSTGVAAYGQIQQGKAAKNAADYQAQVARNNQIIAERKAEDARARGKIASGENDLRTRQLIARQRTGIAGSGQLVDTGSGAEITSDTAALGKLDSLRIVNNAEREASGFENQAFNFGAESELQSFTGKNALGASRTQAFGTLISGAGEVAGKWGAYKKNGTF